MPLQELLRAIKTDAEHERLAADRARTKAAQSLLEQARAEAAELQSEIRLASEREAELEAERVRARARLTAAETVRAGREAAFSRTLELIWSELRTVRGTAAHKALFDALLTEARVALPSATALRIDPRDRALATELACGIRVVETLETSGGLELVGRDGRSVRNTVEERLANAEPLLRQQFARWLATVEPRPGAGP